MRNGPLDPQAVVKLAFLVARRMVAREIADDIAQDTWIKFQAQQAREAHDWDERRARAWVWSVAGNAARSHLRKRPRQSLDASPFDVPSSSEDDPAERVLVAEAGQANRALAWKILGELPRRGRRLLTLRTLEGRSWREIAAILQENERTLRSRYSRLLKRLKGRLVPTPSGDVTEDSHV